MVSWKDEHIWTFIPLKSTTYSSRANCLVNGSCQISCHTLKDRITLLFHFKPSLFSEDIIIIIVLQFHRTCVFYLFLQMYLVGAWSWNYFLQTNPNPKYWEGFYLFIYFYCKYDSGHGSLSLNKCCFKQPCLVTSKKKLFRRQQSGSNWKDILTQQRHKTEGYITERLESVF